MHDVAKLLTPPQNGAVVQLPGRQFPGVVIQGDTLTNLVSLLKNHGNETDEIEKAAIVEEVLDILEGNLDGYFQVCAEAGIEVP